MAIQLVTGPCFVSQFVISMQRVSSLDLFDVICSVHEITSSPFDVSTSSRGALYPTSNRHADEMQIAHRMRRTAVHKCIKFTSWIKLRTSGVDSQSGVLPDKTRPSWCVFNTPSTSRKQTIRCLPSPCPWSSAWLDDDRGIDDSMLGTVFGVIAVQGCPRLVPFHFDLDSFWLMIRWAVATSVALLSLSFITTPLISRNMRSLRVDHCSKDEEALV
mmetsp:Transcript_37088/g.50199  ORF Transcript_37088/g.50199 Transcript_37088/m.50199 type:complete len:216 (+) Transcript_37088:492-1139(+)